MTQGGQTEETGTGKRKRRRRRTKGGKTWTSAEVEGKENGPGGDHRWELPGKYPVFSVVMVIYHYFERTWRVIVTPILIYNIYDH